MTRLYLSIALAEGDTIALPEAAARHAVQVLRLEPGAALTLFNGAGGEFEAVLDSVDKRTATVLVGAHRAVERESALALTLAQCVSKGERMDYTIQKAVELGVSCIQPLLSSRSVVKLDAQRWEKRQEHWQGVVIAACEQCGRNRLPELLPVQALSSWLADGEALRLVLAPGGARTLRKLPSATAASLLVGPEGGLSEDELALALQNGCTAVGLGPRVLRTETAGVAALAALQALWGDLA